MLLKVFKHDFKTLSRYAIPILIALIGVTVLGVVDVLLLGSSVKSISAGAEEDILSTLGVVVGGLGIPFVFFAIATAATLMTFMVYYRFYKSMITDEAYLTLTLPVRPKDLILGKLFSGLLWMTIASIASIASFCIVFAAIFPLLDADATSELLMIFSTFPQVFKEAGFTTWDGVVFVVCSVISMFSGLLQIYFAILFAGSVVKKHKALCAVGMVFGVNALVTTVTQIVTTVVSTGISVGVELGSVSAEYAVSAMYLSMFGTTGVLSLILGVLFFWLCCYFVKNKVNLE